MNDIHYMSRALELAKKGQGYTNPNPMVGAVIVKDGIIISEGYHKKYGTPHAERNAIDHVSEKALLKNATLYVSLEPCCHFGKTPPCTQAIIEAGISRVVVAMEDPNPKVAGNGIKELKNAGISVEVGLLEPMARDLNKIFIHHQTKNRPLLAMKVGQSLDGKIATSVCKSRWITGTSAREDVHRLRHKFMAIMVGIGTVLHDNPLLTCRLPSGGKNPIRIVVDSRLSIPISSKLIETANEVPTIIAHATNIDDADECMLKKIELLKESGISLIFAPDGKRQVDLNRLMSVLGHEPFNINSILIEGGSTLNYSLLKSGLIDYGYIYIAPKLIGGIMGAGSIGGYGYPDPNLCPKLSNIKIHHFNQDILIEGDIDYSCLQES